MTTGSHLSSDSHVLSSEQQIYGKKDTIENIQYQLVKVRSKEAFSLQTVSFIKLNECDLTSKKTSPLMALIP